MKKLIWKDVCTETNFYKALLKVYTKPLFSANRGLSQSHDDKTLFDFAQHTSKNAENLFRSLKSQRFEYTRALAKVFNFNGKIRTLYIYPWREKIVDVLLYSEVSQKFKDLISDNSYAYKWRGSGVDYCQMQVAKYLKNRKECFVLKRDIRNYFPSINHEILIEKIRDLFVEEDYLWELIIKRIQFDYIYEDSPDKDLVAKKGVPFGTPIACWFASLYLSELDREIEKIPDVKHFRYADDILIIADTKVAADKAKEVFKEQIDRLKLESKPSHELNMKLTKENKKEQGYEVVDRFKFLGLQFAVENKIRLSKDKFRKIINLFKRAFKKTYLRKNSKLIEKLDRLILSANRLIEEGVRTVSIIDYYLKHINDEQQLRDLDRWVMEEILALATKKGHKKGNFKYCSPKQFRSLGLISLLHRHRLLKHGIIQSSFFIHRNDRLLYNKKRRKAYK